MNTIFRQELKMNLKSLLYWCIGMGLLIAVAVAEYATVVDADESMMPMLMAMPRIIRVMFGMNAISIDTPMGYFACMLLWYEFVAFFHAAFMGASILAKEERDRTADYIFTKPYSRNTVINGKVLAAVVNMLILNVLTCVISEVAFGNPDGSGSIQKEITYLMIGMFLVQLIFFSLSLLISSITKTQKSASSYSMGCVLIAYLLGVWIEYNEMGKIDFLSFFRYFHAEGIVTDGIRVGYVMVSIALIAIFTVLAYRFYNKKDLQV